MKWLALALVALILAGPSYGQDALPANSKTPDPKNRSAETIYKMTKTDDSTVLLRKFSRVVDKYEVVDFRRRMGTHEVGSIRSIVELSDAELADELRAEKQLDVATTPRMLGRTSVRTSARTTGRVPTPDPDPTLFPPGRDHDDFPLSSLPMTGGSRTSATVEKPEYVPSSAGYTATGLPLHTGPRGGVYHYSKSGKKVYQKK